MVVWRHFGRTAVLGLILLGLSMESPSFDGPKWTRLGLYIALVVSAIQTAVSGLRRLRAMGVG